MIKDGIWHPKRCNCIIWAYLMNHLHGGEGSIHKINTKNWENGFHVVWQSPEGLYYSYEPINKTPVGWLEGWSQALFVGKVTTHTKEEMEERKLIL